MALQFAATEMGVSEFQNKAIADFVTKRRERTGRKFETCERMKPVFKDLDDAGWNDWPPREDAKS
jgi:hypothetical protein